MRERPILFSGPMVKAILENRKTQTRRVLKPQHPDWWPDYCAKAAAGYSLNEMKLFYPNGKPAPLPYGYPGDSLWVKENFWIEHDSDSDGFRSFDCGINIKEDSWTKVQYCATPLNPGRPPGEWWSANWDENGPIDDGQKEWVEWQFYSKQPSIFMPRWASRITLEVTGVRVERVKAISEYDAEREGIEVSHYYCDEGTDLDPTPIHRCDPIGKFSELWDSINGKRPGCSWNANPWVWCITFRRIGQ